MARASRRQARAPAHAWGPTLVTRHRSRRGRAPARGEHATLSASGQRRAEEARLLRAADGRFLPCGRWACRDV